MTQLCSGHDTAAGRHDGRISDAAISGMNPTDPVPCEAKCAVSGYAPVQLAYEIYSPTCCGVGEQKGAPGPIFLIHGALSCKEGWYTIPQAIADRTNRRVVSYDLRNHGRSGWSESYSIADNVLDLRGLMRALGCGRAVLVGHSLGGKVAIHFATQFPEEAEAVVVEDMFASAPPPWLCSLAASFATGRARTALRSIAPHTAEDAAAAAVARRVYADALPKWLFRNARHVLLPVSRLLWSCATRAVGDFLSSLYKPKRDAKEVERRLPPQPASNWAGMGLLRLADGRLDFRANLPVLERAIRGCHRIFYVPDEVYPGPALFIYGESSVFNVMGDVDNIVRPFPRAEFAGVRTASHAVHNSCQDEFVDVVVRWLTALPTPHPQQ